MTPNLWPTGQTVSNFGAVAPIWRLKVRRETAIFGDDVIHVSSPFQVKRGASCTGFDTCGLDLRRPRALSSSTTALLQETQDWTARSYTVKKGRQRAHAVLSDIRIELALRGSRSGSCFKRRLSRTSFPG